jgi:hypothetical protein
MGMSKYIDERNQDLWERINVTHTVEIQIDQATDHYRVYTKGNKSIIYVPGNDLSPSSFTHELLHIYLRTKGIFIGGGLVGFVRENLVLQKIFSEPLLEHIGNCLDHIKVFPLYLEMGYEREKFIFDYFEPKLTRIETDNIKNNFFFHPPTGAFYIGYIIDLYIGKFFAAKTCKNPSFDYSGYLGELFLLDSALFQILGSFTTAWDGYDINNHDPLNSYHLILFDFVDKMEEWCKGKKII